MCAKYGDEYRGGTAGRSSPTSASAAASKSAMSSTGVSGSSSCHVAAQSVGRILCQDRGEDGDQGLRVVVVARQTAGIVQLLHLDLVPVQTMARLGQQLIEELTLGPTIPLTERVGEVRVVVQVGDLPRQIGEIDVPQLVRLPNALGNMTQRPRRRAAE